MVGRSLPIRRTVSVTVGVKLRLGSGVGPWTVMGLVGEGEAGASILLPTWMASRVVVKCDRRRH